MLLNAWIKHSVPSWRWMKGTHRSMRMCSPTGRQRECAPPRRGEARPEGVRARTGNGGAGYRRGCEAVLARRAAYIVGCVGTRLAGDALNLICVRSVDDSVERSNPGFTCFDVIVAVGSVCHVDLLHVIVFIHSAFNRNKLGGLRARGCRLGHVVWCSAVVRSFIPVRLWNCRRGDVRLLRRRVLGGHGHHPLQDRLGGGGLGDVRTCVDIPDRRRFALGLT